MVKKKEAKKKKKLAAAVSKKKGRPSMYSQKLANKICQELAQGVSLRSVCKGDGMPSAAAVFDWLATNEKFVEQYARAKQESSDAMAEEILDIADDGTNDWEERTGNRGSTYMAVNNEAVQRSKLRVETRKWLMAKMKPKKYGDKIDLTSAGEAIKGNAIMFGDFKNAADRS